MGNNRYSSEATNEFNMNMAWLEKISRNIDIFILCRFEEDFENMFNALDTLEMLTSPKIDDDALEKKLKWLNNNKESWCVRDNSGKILRINNKNRNILKSEFRTAFRLILLRLDEAGILTKLKEDPGKAMGKFNG